MTLLELQQKADWAESMRETLYDLKTRRLGAPSDGGAAKPGNPSTAAGLELTQKGTSSQPAASSSLDWIVPALVGALIGLGLYLTYKGGNY